MTTSHGTASHGTASPGTAVPTQRNTLQRRLAELRGGPDVPPRPMDARALAALAANPGCQRRALLDGAGVDKGTLASALGAPSAFGQSQFAFVRGNAFEARVTAEGGTELIDLLCARSGESPPEPGGVAVPDLTADGPSGRAARTRLALLEASAAGRWAVLRHPMVTLEVAGSPVFLEPDAVVVHPDGGWSIVEIKSFPILDGSADSAKVGAAARQAAVYALALERLAEQAREAEWEAEWEADGNSRAAVEPAARPAALLVCPRDFTNLPTAALVDVRKQMATTRRQLARLTRLEEITETLPDETSFDPSLPSERLTDSVAAVPAAYAPECLASCELAFHCRAAARSRGDVAVLGRGVRGELGGLVTVDTVLAAASGTGPEGGESDANGEGREVDEVDDATSVNLRRAARLRTEALANAAAPGC